MGLSFLISLLTGEAADIAQRARRSMTELSIMLLAVLFGLFFLTTAAFLFVADNMRYGALNTALIFAGVFLAIAAATLIVRRVGQSVRARRARERRKGDMAAAAGAAAVAALPLLLSRRGGIAGILLPAIAALGFAIYRENASPRDDDRAD